MEDVIKIRGARQHNLKNINIDIPKNRLVVFTGISGSGKSSLAFDTLYAEGQRRYVESLSSYARQFLGIMDKPDVDSISGLSPAISIDQKSTSHNPRSTIGTVTEIYDYLRLLYARIGHPHCPNCGREIATLSKEQIIDQIKTQITLNLSEQKQYRFMIISPIIKDKKGEYSQLFNNLRQKGYSRVRVDGQIFDLNEDFVLIKTNKHKIDAVIDRFSVGKINDLDISRLSAGIETALNLSEGEVIISEIGDKSFDFPQSPKIMRDSLYSERFACPTCNISLPAIEPRSFSFNSPHGACPTCGGIGSLLKVDHKLIFAPGLTIDEGCILPFSKMFENDTWYSRIIRTVCKKYGINTKIPASQLNQKDKDILLNGTGDEIHEVYGTNRQGENTTIIEPYQGIIPELERRLKETDSDFIRAEIEKFMREEVCPECHGLRLKKESLSITIQNLRITDITEKPINNVLDWVKSITLSSKETTISQPIFKELTSRLTFLVNVGLDYLTLGRSSKTLSGGEAQRIRLASQIGSGLSGILYVLDEPSIGLHQKDNKKLITTLKTLRDLGNTVVVVEHDQETMEEADYIFDFGPEAGEKGGFLISNGSPQQIKKDTKSLTGQYLSGKKSIPIYELPNIDSGNHDDNILIIKGASEHNLKSVDVSIPLNKFVCITGVSGSGKSTLINDILYHALAMKFNPYHKELPGKFETLMGDQNIDRVVLVDQSPIGRTPRSNPATYTGCFNYIREIFANTKEAKLKGFNMGRFSFNVRGGRCETCEGEGQIRIEMQFLPDVYVACESCKGRRYNEGTLEILYKNKNISDVLNMTVDEAVNFFPVHHALSVKLQTLQQVGLGYIKLGQPAPQLSGGEAQRVKLATELAKQSKGRCVYLLDEPTTGLHFADLEKLIYVLKTLVAKGNTVIVIEHNLDVIKNADWIIDLGPEGGDKGGYVVGFGTPYEIASNSKSYTGQFLRAILK